MIQALRERWAEVFAVAHTSFDGESALEWLAGEGGLPPLSWRDSCRMPQWRCYRQFLQRAQESGPGPDGEPYSAWRAFGEKGAQLHDDIGSWMRSGHVMPMAFNLLSLVLPPENFMPEEGSNVVRRPSETRPLSSKKH